MVTFRDLKYYFHRLGGMFGWVGDLVRGWPWPLDYLAWPFDNIENVFYERDWLFDGLDTWVSGIAADASNAWSYASSAYSNATSALNWINTTGSTAYSYAVSAYNNAVNALNWINSSGVYAYNTANSAYNAAIAAGASAAQSLNAITWINSIEIPGLKGSIAEIWAALTALEVPDLAAIIQDIAGLKAWRDEFIAALDEKIADVISRTVDSILDRVEW